MVKIADIANSLLRYLCEKTRNHHLVLLLHECTKYLHCTVSQWMKIHVGDIIVYKKDELILHYNNTCKY